jgi:hypothetical protein
MGVRDADRAGAAGAAAARHAVGAGTALQMARAGGDVVAGRSEGADRAGA